MYNNGEGVRRDYRRAIKLLKQSLAGGDLYAGYPLGWNYERGHGAPKNYQEARRLYALASAHGKIGVTNALKKLDEKIRVECPLIGNQVVVAQAGGTWMARPE